MPAMKAFSTPQRLWLCDLLGTLPKFFGILPACCTLLAPWSPLKSVPDAFRAPKTGCATCTNWGRSPSSSNNFTDNICEIPQYASSCVVEAAGQGNFTCSCP